ncbi:hypothetical protein DOY81_004771 [Sarcophaga bullata]|nr:hypothetical protein DOY81_004771 [Sarcophaga bullata]
MLFLMQTSRKFSTTTSLLVKHFSKRSNPGLGYQISAIEDAADIIKSDPEGFGDLESDLMEAHKSHRQHELEVKKQNDKIRQSIVERKYFRKEPLPNLLTYAEKEQIKYLHSGDKDEWTIEKLAESFPASVETIRKILKSHWTPLSAKRILAHDATVFRNWERFKKGEYKTKMSTELQNHLEKFADRSPADLKLLQDPTKALPKKQWQKPISNEFSSLLTLQSARDQIKESSALTTGDKPENINQQHSDDTYLLGKIENKKPMTMKELRDSLAQSNSNLESNTLIKEPTHEINHINDTGIVKGNLDSLKLRSLDYTEKFATTEIVINESDSKKYGISATKERIHIPRKLWRKGFTYRVYDSYYDDDGEFLYRIPGMTPQ